MKFPAWMRTITPTEMAKRDLDDHRRNLISTMQVQESAVATVAYHERCIANLQKTLGQQEAKIAVPGTALARVHN